MSHDPATLLGPRFGNDDRAQKLPGTDGVMGLVLLLAYYAGGWNLFPSSINPLLYLIEERLPGRKIQTDTNLLLNLVEEMSLKTNYELGLLQSASLKVYLGFAREGRGPNNRGYFPSLKGSTFSLKYGLLTLCPRNYHKDVEDRTILQAPPWIRTLEPGIARQYS